MCFVDSGMMKVEELWLVCVLREHFADSIELKNDFYKHILDYLGFFLGVIIVTIMAICQPIAIFLF